MNSCCTTPPAPGHKAILSGPAGGYVGYASTTQWEGVRPSQLQMIGFDMGGTSTGALQMGENGWGSKGRGVCGGARCVPSGQH